MSVLTHTEEKKPLESVINTTWSSLIRYLFLHYYFLKTIKLQLLKWPYWFYYFFFQNNQLNLIKKEQPEQVKHLFIFPSKWLLAGKTFIRYWYSHTQISPPAALQCLGSLGGQYFYYCVLMSTIRNTRVDDVSQRQVMGLFRGSSAPFRANEFPSPPLSGSSHCWGLEEFCHWRRQQNKIRYKLPGLKYLCLYHLAALAGH